MSPLSHSRLRLPLVFLAFWSSLLASSSAVAEIERKGDWPDEDKNVSLSLDSVPRAEAIKRLAAEAGWSVVIDAPPTSPVSVEVKDQPPSKVLELILSDAKYVASRDGNLISISKGDALANADDAAAEAPSPPPPPPAVPAPPPAAISNAKGEDRVVTGGSTRVEASEVVHDLVVMGGSAEVLGTVTGDLVVMGGSATVRKGATVKGDASVVGGSLDVEDGATVEGEVGVVGGKLNRGGESSLKLKLGKGEAARGFTGWLSDFAGAITRIALLFVFGTVLLALGTARMEAMQGEIAARPMRTFALGVVGSLVALLAVIVLCVTVIGIPIAVVALLFGVLGTYAGICAALTTAGAALMTHKNKSPYLHLGLGCILFLLASSLPWIGDFVTAGVVLFGIGALVATRGAGFFVRKTKNEGPYRTSAAT